MTVNVSGRPIELKCTEQVFSEFPNLLFGNTIDNGSFFDATSYLQNNPITVDDFLSKCEWMIEALVKSYELDPKKCFLLNNEGHILIDGNLTYLFLSFVEQDFFAYMCDRCHDLFTNGIAVSDSYLLEEASERLNEESLKKIRSNDK